MEPLLFNEIPNDTQGPIEIAAEKSISALREREHLTESHALIIQMIRSLARACDRGLMAPRVSVATTTMMRQLSDLVLSLPGTEPISEGGINSDLAAALDELKNA